MRIDSSNGKIINSGEINLHDEILNQLSFDRSTSELCLLIAKESDCSSTYTIKFANTIGFGMTSCDFWGRSPHIFDFEYVEDERRTLLPKLYKMQEDNPNDQWCKLETDKKYIETVITFTSGDKLTIVCELIILE